MFFKNFMCALAMEFSKDFVIAYGSYLSKFMSHFPVSSMSRFLHYAFPCFYELCI